MYDCVIVGSGPAGLSAAVYAKRAGMNLVVLEKAPMSGGQILNTYEVDNYLGLPGMNGFDMGMQFRAHADKLDIEFREAEAVNIEKSGDHFTIVTQEETFEAKTVIWAAGAIHAKLDVPGEEELNGMGVSYCATCDGAFFRNKTVAVVGGGDVALEDAIFLAGLCEKVYLVHRRDEFRGAAVLKEELEKCQNVEFLYHSVVEAIQGEDKVEAVKVRDLKQDCAKDLPVDGVFIAVGIRPNTEAIQKLVETDEGGYVTAGENCATTTPGFYVAGDLRKKPARQVVTAVADGANAALSAASYCKSLKL